MPSSYLDIMSPSPDGIETQPLAADAKRKTNLSAWYLPNPIRILLHVLLPPSTRMSAAHELGVLFEPRRDSLGRVRIALHELDHLLLLPAHIVL